MNYRHLFHAGGFADVIKHVFLIALSTSRQKKLTPLCYIDTHAGAGYYDLFSHDALKNKEFNLGIERVTQGDNPPALIKKYIACVRQINNELTGSNHASLRFYPGSPLIIKYNLRPHDQLIACELQPQEYRLLKFALKGDKQVAVHHMNGYQGLKAFLPPSTKRGLVLIDPPYENPAEFKHLARNLSLALKRWPTGMYIIWYPIKEKSQIYPFYRTLAQVISHPILAVEATLFPDLPHHLNGCGLIIVNFPYQFSSIAQELIEWLWKTLSIHKQGSYTVKELK